MGEGGVVVISPEWNGMARDGMGWMDRRDGAVTSCMDGRTHGARMVGCRWERYE